MHVKVQVLWSIFFITIVFSILNIIGSLSGLSFLQIDYFHSFVLSIPVILILLHSIWTLSFFRGIIFISIACVTGFLFEYFGLKYDVLFGGDYIYSAESLKILSVPLSVIFYWGVFIYTGYCISNSFLYWSFKEKPMRNRKVGYQLPLFILLDCFIVVAIDLFMDPIQVQTGGWVWENGGSYFGIPIGNFIGWALVVIITTGLYRVYEYFNPIVTDKEFIPVFLIPVLGYGLLYLNFLSSAIVYKMSTLIFIGSLTMLPVVMANLYMYSNFIKSKIGF